LLGSPGDPGGVLSTFCHTPTAVVSIGAVALLLLMLRVRGASRAASVFFLVPAGSVALAFLVLGERLEPLQLVGTIVVTAAVALISANIGREKPTVGQ
jgi:drug/metabolite transporter (DMT)-like permease